MLHRILLTAASVAALTTAANAADMYPAHAEGGYKDAPYSGVNWNGLYVGVNSGYGWSANGVANGLNDDNPNGAKPEGGFGGGQIGYNWQGVWHPHVVLGVEADIQGSAIAGSFTDINFGDNGSSKLDWFGTVRGRAGYTYDRALFYITGGFAFGGLDKTFQGPLLNGSPYHFSGTGTGYVLGGGLEYEITPAWSVKAEYQYIDLGKNDLTNAAGKGLSSFPGYSIYRDDAFNTVRVGINYHVGRTYEPLK